MKTLFERFSQEDKDFTFKLKDWTPLYWIEWDYVCKEEYEASEDYDASLSPAFHRFKCLLPSGMKVEFDIEDTKDWEKQEVCENKSFTPEEVEAINNFLTPYETESFTINEVLAG